MDGTQPVQNLPTLDEALADWREAVLIADAAAALGEKREAAVARKQARPLAWQIAQIVDRQDGKSS
jgi:hypothetical protein